MFIKHTLFYLIFLNDRSFSLDKTLTETVILTFNHLESIDVHYMDTNPGMFLSKTLISF